MSVMEERSSAGRVDPCPGAWVRVLAVDDQDYFRGVMCEVVNATEGFCVVAEAASGEEALEVVAAVAPSMVIIDKRMPGMGGVAACRRLTAQYPEIAVIIVSIEDPDPLTASSTGAAGFLRKEELSPRALRELWSAHGGSSS